MLNKPSTLTAAILLATVRTWAATPADLDPIAATAVQRCTAFGYSKGTKDFASCAREQTRLITENTSSPMGDRPPLISEPKDSAKPVPVQSGSSYTSGPATKVDGAVAGNDQTVERTPDNRRIPVRLPPKLKSLPADMDKRNNELRKRTRIAGANVTVRACVDVNGKVSTWPSIAVSSGYKDWDALALQFAAEAIYQPGTEDGTAVVMCTQYMLQSSFSRSSKANKVSVADADLASFNAQLPMLSDDWILKSVSRRSADVYTAMIELKNANSTDSMESIYSTSARIQPSVKKFFCSNKLWSSAFDGDNRIFGIVTDSAGKQLFYSIVQNEDCGLYRVIYRLQ